MIERSQMTPFHNKLLGAVYIRLITPLSILLGSLEELLGLGREGLLKRGVAHLLHQEVAELTPVGLLRVEDEWVLTLSLELWVVVPEVSVATLHSLLTYGLCAGHTALDTVVDTRSVGDDERWAWVCLSLLKHVEELLLRCSDRYLSNVYIAVGHCNSADILLADALTG